MKKVFFPILVVWTLALGACSTAAASRNPDSITIGIVDAIKSFDPFSTMTAEARSVAFNIYEGLVNVDTDGSFVPAVAQSYEVSPDAKTYTFTLREGVVFHNGAELRAEDVLYSIQRAIDSSLVGYDKIERFGIDGKDRIIIRLSAADPGFIAYLATPIVPKDHDDLALHPVGTGPYRLSDYVEQDHVTLSRHDSYWGAGGTLKNVTLTFVASQTNLVAEFQAGHIDGFSANADVVVRLKQDKITMYQRNSNAVQLLALNNAVEPFKHADVRRAINYLVDADEIIQSANYGYGVKVGSALTPALSKYYDRSLVGTYTRNVAKAKELLQKSGYDKGFSFTITVPSIYSVHVQAAKIIAKQLAAAGIKASVKQVDWNTWLQAVYGERKFDATVISLTGAIAYPSAYLSRYVSDASNNFINYASDAYDTSYARAISTTSEEERVAAFKEAQRILNEECASVFIQDISMLTVYSKDYAGNRDYPLYATDFSAIYRVED